MNIKGVIFDFNGTLFFDNDKHILAWGEISNLIRGHGINDVELHEHFNGVPNKQIVQYMLNGNCDEEVINKYSSLKEQYYREFCKADKPTFHLVSGAEAYFNQLEKRQIPFTIASASIKENIDFFIESFNLDQWINPKDIVYDDGTYKNKIAMFKKAAEILKVDLKETLIVEDSLSGIQNAYQAGCRNIIVINSANKKEQYKELPGVIRVIDTFDELLPQNS